jgi:Eukaryotic porin
MSSSQFFSGYSNCEVPAPENPEDSKESKEEPIIFDELENPMIAEQAKKYPLRPPSFEMLLQPLRLATLVEPLEGLKVDFGLGISQRMQISNSWLLPHGQGGSYDITLMFAGGKMANPYDYVSPNPFLMARLNPGLGRQDAKLIYKIKDNIETRITGNYLSSDPRDCHVQAEIDYNGKDFVTGGKIGIGGEFLSLSYIQSLTRSLIMGVEVTGLRKPRQMAALSYGGKYSFGTTSIYAQYLQMQEMLHIGSCIKGNSNITYSTELVYSGMSREMEFALGISIRFTRAKLNAQLSGSGKLVASLQHAVNPFIKISLHGEADFVKQEQKFGLGLLLGSG